ncbi:MAG: SRPBCC family protein [Acidimicrobiales bacterium]
MIQRELVVPVPPERLWEALTDPDAVETWFGSRVRWDLVPGGQAAFTEDDGGRRLGRVEEVATNLRLRYRWWPEDDEGSSSQVTYTLHPEDDGTRLTVTEERMSASASTASSAISASWTAWDARLLGVWAAVAAEVWAGAGARVAVDVAGA